jgi:alkylation response protein AidB-like acyl-CoA dehydrogenase
MNFGLSEDQASILAGLDQLIAAQAPAAPTAPDFVAPAPVLEAAVAEAGYLDVAREDGFGPLESALVVERLARLPHAMEAAASALIAPALGIERGLRPIALAQGDMMRPARFLTTAQALLVDRGDDAVMLRLSPGDALPVETLLAYPYGRLSKADFGLVPVDVRTLRRRWRIALAVEAAGCMAAGLAQVVDHVTNRRAFGRPLGSLQAIQHRLAMAAETAEAAKWLAFRAAWSDTEADAALAAAFAQGRIAEITYDLQQFSGAMGLTLEFPLHLWTYRLRALAGELGGASVQKRAAAAATWPDQPSASARI